MTEEVVALVREAGEILRSHYRAFKSDEKSLLIRAKSDDSPVTAADVAVDRFLRPALEELSGFPVISEEHLTDYETRKNWSDFWLLDPLDGTKDFIAKNDEYSIALALVRGGKPVLGVIYGPELDELYVGEADRVAWFERGRRDGAKRERMPYRSPSPPICARSRFHHTVSVEDFAREHRLSLSACGSALKFGRVAAGEYRAYASFGAPSEWDVAAGLVIVEASGGSLTPHRGRFSWNTPNLKVGTFEAWGAP